MYIKTQFREWADNLFIIQLFRLEDTPLSLHVSQFFRAVPFEIHSFIRLSMINWSMSVAIPSRKKATILWFQLSKIMCPQTNRNSLGEFTRVFGIWILVYRNRAEIETNTNVCIYILSAFGNIK